MGQKSITNGTLLGSMLLGSLLLGCPSDSSSDEKDAADDVGDETPSDAGAQSGADAGTDAPVDSDAKVGTFTLRLVAPTAASGSTAASPGYTKVSGTVYSGVVPEEVAWDLDLEQGGCKLVKPRVPFCDPGCGQDVCVDEDVCKPHVKPTSAGTVTLSGLKSTSNATADVAIEPINGSYSTPADAKLAYPPFAEGDAIKLTAKGADAPAFSITSHGIADLELTSKSFALKTGNAFALTWKAAGKSDNSRVQVKLDISHHGGTKGKIECDVPDNGSLDIAADLVTRLLKLGVAGFPTIVVDRVSSGSTATKSGTVVLNVVSEIEQAVEIDGLSSCTDSADCPQGKTCQTDLTCK